MWWVTSTRREVLELTLIPSLTLILTAIVTLDDPDVQPLYDIGLRHIFNPQGFTNVTYPITRPGSKGSIDYILYSGGLRLVSTAYRTKARRSSCWHMIIWAWTCAALCCTRARW